jgi:hypothetical protein
MMTDGEGLGNLPIGVAGFTLTLIAHRQNAGDQVVLGWDPFGWEQCEQSVG